MTTFEDDDPREIPRNPHTRFRALKVWKDFRGEMIKRAGYRCEYCNGLYRGIKARKLQVHHLDPDNYETLTPDQFRVLCASCHNDYIELWVTKIQGKQWTPGPNFLGVYRAIRDFLPIKAREIAGEWVRKIESGILTNYRN